MTDFDDAARALQTRDTIETTVDLGGQTVPVEIREPTLDELEAIDESLTDGDDETDAIKRIVDTYLERPDIDAGQVSLPKLRALFEEMRDSWQRTAGIEDARDEMPLEGNR